MDELICILYVDDEECLLEISKIFLERTGPFSVDIVTSAPAALDMMKARHYDAIISDYQMPEMDGIEFLRSVRTAGDSIPFIIFTGKGREEVEVQAFSCGADAYLQKGGNPKEQFAELALQIRKAVQKRRESAVPTSSEVNEIGEFDYL
jgi:CheY-like chemotaxis protein